MTADYKTQTYSGTGEQDIINRSAEKSFSLAIQAGDDDVYDIQVTLQPANVSGTPTRYTIRAGVSGDFIETFVGPVMGVALDITTNTSTAIKLEILTSYRF